MSNSVVQAHENLIYLSERELSRAFSRLWSGKDNEAYMAKTKLQNLIKFILAQKVQYRINNSWTWGDCFHCFILVLAMPYVFLLQFLSSSGWKSPRDPWQNFFKSDFSTNYDFSLAGPKGPALYFEMVTDSHTHSLTHLLTLTEKYKSWC